MPLFAHDRKPRLAPECDDVELGRTLKALRRQPHPRAVYATDLRASAISTLLGKTGMDWDRRSHRLAVLAQATAHTSIPSVWIKHEPERVDAMLLYAWSEVLRAPRKEGMEDPEGAVRFCHRAADLSPQDPIPWVVLLAMSRVECYGRSDVIRIWQEAIARDRWNREAHLQLLGYLSPDECGSRMQVIDFVDHVRHRIPSNAPACALELTAAVRQYCDMLSRGGVEAIMARDFWKHREAASPLSNAVDTWLQPGFLRHAAAPADLNVLAYALVAAGQKAQAARAFAALAGAVASWPWGLDSDPVSAYSRSRLRCS
ncbi:hypothetical protein ACFU7X_00685 [Streptomyces chartreusis]|uniref:hypothetical protein n=1 Tax=Streptomyces chartreusis TaxID=1969 RepID=UPI00367F9082